MTPNNNYREVPLDVIDRMHAADEGLGVKVSSSGRISFTPFSEIKLAALTPYVVKNLIGEGDIVAIYAEPKAAKSFLALHIAHRVSLGRRVFGQRAKKTVVAFFALEGAGGLIARVEAYRKKHGDTGDVYIHTRPLPLFDNFELEAELVAAVNAVGAKLIVIDTLAKAMVGGNENLAEDINKMIAVFERVRDATGAATLIVHHAGKDRARGMRGSNALLGAVDLEAEVVKAEDGTRALIVQNARHVPSGVAYPFDLEVVDLGPDEEGDARSSCVVVELGGPVAAKATKKPAKMKKLPAGAKNALDALAEAINEHPALTPADLPKGLRVTSLTDWEAIARKRAVEKKPNALRMQLTRAADRLQAERLIQIRHDLVWIARA